jgi:hypothetical protein
MWANNPKLQTAQMICRESFLIQAFCLMFASAYGEDYMGSLE